MKEEVNELEKLSQEFLNKPENKANALSHAYHLWTLFGNEPFTVNKLRKKLHNADRKEIAQLLHALKAFGHCKSVKVEGTERFYILFDNKAKLALLRLEKDLVEQKLEVINSQMKDLEEKIDLEKSNGESNNTK